MRREKKPYCKRCGALAVYNDGRNIRLRCKNDRCQYTEFSNGAETFVCGAATVSLIGETTTFFWRIPERKRLTFDVRIPITYTAEDIEKMMLLI